jgi:hypothetical protein
VSAEAQPAGPPAPDPDVAALFADELARLEEKLAVPYPDRALLLEELAADVSAVYAGLRAQGIGEEAARQQALRSLELDPETIRALEDVHVPAVRRALSRLPPPVRQWLEIAATAGPLAAMFLFLITEVPLNLFLSEGGRANYFVMATGMLGLFIEMQRFFIWFVLRDHSIAALRRNTPTPLYLAAATVLLGMLGTALEFYGFLFRVGRRQISLESLAWAGRQPLSCVIVGTSLATCIVLVHSALGVGLRAIRIPEAKQKAD